MASVGPPLTPGQSQFVSRLSSETGLNPGVVTAWVLAEESGQAAQARQAQGNHNWLNIGYFDSGPGAIAHAKQFSNPISAADATAAFLRGTWGGASPGIQSILHTAHADPMSQINAIAHSGWASSGYNGGSSLRQLFGQYGGHVPAQVSSGGNQGFNVPSVETTLTGGGTNGQALALDLLRSGAVGGDMLHRLTSDIEGGHFSTPSVANSKLTYASSSKLLPEPKGTGDVNPVAGFKLGRTDMGVDAVAKPGTPIRAINDSKVVRVTPDWFRGQPLVEFEILSGPNKGRMWYVAEQIANHAQVGDVIRRGQPVAYFAPSGTGIEIGWGAPGGATEAQATTGYHEGQVTPAGQDFRNLLTNLGAR